MALYHHPADTFVALFIGAPAMNLIGGRIQPGLTAVLANGVRFRCPDGLGLRRIQPITLGIRAEILDVVNAESFLFEGRVAVQEELGEFNQLCVETSLNMQPIVVKVAGEIGKVEGKTLRFAADPARLHVFGPDGRALPKVETGPFSSIGPCCGSRHSLHATALAVLTQQRETDHLWQLKSKSRTLQAYRSKPSHA